VGRARGTCRQLLGWGRRTPPTTRSSSSAVVHDDDSAIGGGDAVGARGNSDTELWRRRRLWVGGASSSSGRDRRARRGPKAARRSRRRPGDVPGTAFRGASEGARELCRLRELRARLDPRRRAAARRPTARGAASADAGARVDAIALRWSPHRAGRRRRRFRVVALCCADADPTSARRLPLRKLRGDAARFCGCVCGRRLRQPRGERRRLRGPPGRVR